MRKYLFITLLAVLSANIAKATVLFPFYSDISSDNKTIVRLVDEKNRFEQILKKGSLTWGTMSECISFMEDVLPEDVIKPHPNDKVMIYSSPFHTKERDTLKSDNVLSVIYVINKGSYVEVYYTESNDVQQKNWEEEILKGKYSSIGDNN